MFNLKNHFEYEAVTKEKTICKFKINFSNSQAASVWRFPVETVSQSEEGFEKTYQGSCILIHWIITLNGNKSTELGIEIDIQ